MKIQQTKLPDYIQEWYAETAEDFGQKTQPYCSLILIQYALENGAVKPKDETAVVKKSKWNDHGELIEG